jgi:tetratricopeptide (TPR) repeat protein
VVGDPLYRPFGKNPEAQHAMLIQRHSPLVEWSYLRLVNLNLAVGKTASDMVTLLEQVDLTKQSAVLSEKLADLYAAQGKPASAIQAAQSALKLNPSLEQKIRLRLTLGDWLTAQHQTEEAYANYQALAQESPDYPDKLAILRKLLPLAQQLKKDADASKYETEIRGLSPPPKS